MKIDLETFYPYPPEDVWQALTDPAALASWYMANEGFRPEVGARFLFRSKPVLGWKGVAHCEMLAVERPRRLAWTQTGGPDDPFGFTVSWTLTPAEGGTRLRLEQDGMRGLRGFMVTKFMGAGWSRLFGTSLPRTLAYAAARGWGAFPAGRRLQDADLGA